MSDLDAIRRRGLDDSNNWPGWAQTDRRMLLTLHDALAAELALLSDKSCAAVVAYRAALTQLTDSFKYSTEVVTIARNALEAK